MCLNTILLNILEYPLLALNLPKGEYDKIMAPILTGGFPKIGTCRSLPREIVYRTIKNQGTVIHNLFTTQGIVNIQKLLDHIWRDTETGE